MQKYHLHLYSDKKETSQFSDKTLVKCINFVTADDDDNDDELLYGCCIVVVWLTEERRLDLFPPETIVRDPHHRESPARR